MQKIKLIFLLLIVAITSVYAHKNSIDYIIDSDIGGDIDDALTILLSLQQSNKPLAITTTHIEPKEKARIAKIIMAFSFFPEIPEYAGIGTAREESNAIFLEQNPLWPPVFGYPQPSTESPIWYPKQAASYRESYGSLFDTMRIDEESAPEYIARIAKMYSPQQPLIIVSIGPLHNIAAALRIAPEISNRIKIYAMGGVYPKGYNWLVSPAITAEVLEKVETVVVLDSLIESERFYILPEEFELLEKNTHSQLGLAVIRDWKNWYKMDTRKLQKTNLSDVIALYLALHPEEITALQPKHLVFPCLDDKGNLKPEFIGLWYNMPGLEEKLMKAEDVEHSHIQFVTQLKSSSVIKKKIIAAIEKALN